MTEQWKTIPGFEQYEASSLGRIRRITATRNHPAGHVLKPWKTPNGYVQVILYGDGKSLQTGVHRLICMAFHGVPPFTGAQAAHDDGNRQNNAASNLRWATGFDNCQDRRRHGSLAYGERNGAYTKPENRVRGERNGTSKLNADLVRQIRSSDLPSPAAAKMFGVCRTTIKYIRRGKAWAHVDQGPA